MKPLDANAIAKASGVVALRDAFDGAQRSKSILRTASSPDASAALRVVSPGEVIKRAVELDGVITQDGIARVFAERYGERLRFCHDAGAWYKWTGNWSAPFSVDSVMLRF
jgi:hypothetical protein